MDGNFVLISESLPANTGFYDVLTRTGKQGRSYFELCVGTQIWEVQSIDLIGEDIIAWRKIEREPEYTPQDTGGRKLITWPPSESIVLKHKQ